MNPRHALIAAGLTGIASVGVLYWQTPSLQVSPTPEAAPAAQQRVHPVSEVPASSVIVSTTQMPDEQEARMAFHAETRTFFAQAAALPADERAARAKRITAGVTEYESRGELSAGEALLLKIALIRESLADPQQQAQQIAELERTYRLDTDRRQAAHAARRDPMFELYKLRENAIVTNVMAMNEIPGGLSRDEYLRQQLQSERELLLESATP